MSAIAGANLGRRFGGVQAVDGVDLEVAAGEVVAVVGPNGSGKSTLIDLLTGVVTADSGSVWVNSRPLRRVVAAAVARRGVRRTFQNGRLIDPLSALDNVRVGLHVGSAGRRFAVAGPTRSPSRVALREMGVEHLADRAVAQLSQGERRRIELARALVGSPRALVLDEPTSGLPRADGRRLTRLLRRIAASGIGVLMIEHDLEMVRACADRVLVMVDGRICAQGDITVLDDAAVRLALGLSQSTAPPAATGTECPTVLHGHGLCVRRAGRSVLHDVTVDVRAGEVVTLLGGNGSGKTTLLAALSGLVPLHRGAVTLAEQTITGWAADRLARSGMAHLPQRRHLFGSLSTADNLAVSDAAAAGRSPLPLDGILNRLPELSRLLQVPVNRLSGGEQQLVMLARGLRTRPSVILADEPSAALAPGTRQRIFAWLRDLADEGAAVLLAEQNATEATAIANRTMTLRDGQMEPVSPTAEVVA